MFLNDDNEPCLTREELWVELKKRGATKAVVHFCGGNDEGSVNGIDLLDATGAKIAELQEEWAPTEWDETQKKHVRKTPIKPDEALVKALVKPVYDKYYSFAGEFYVNGTVTFDVETKVAHMEASETVESYEAVDEYL
jgi:hypothetical protein